MNDSDYTRKFNVSYDKDQEIKAILTSVYASLREMLFHVPIIF